MPKQKGKLSRGRIARDAFKKEVLDEDDGNRIVLVTRVHYGIKVFKAVNPSLHSMLCYLFQESREDVWINYEKIKLFNDMLKNNVRFLVKKLEQKRASKKQSERSERRKRNE